MRRYGQFTPARRAALHRASLISAAKRRGRAKSPMISTNGHVGRNKAIRRAAIGVAAVGAAYVVGREVQGTNTYHKTKLKAYNVTTKRKVGTKRVQISKEEYRFIKAADAHMGTSDTPPFKIGIDSRVKINVYKKQLRTKQNRKDVFHSIDKMYKDVPRTTFKSRSQTRTKRRKARRNMRGKTIFDMLH